MVPLAPIASLAVSVALRAKKRNGKAVQWTWR
jgi:hypothetical protein